MAPVGKSTHSSVHMCPESQTSHNWKAESEKTNCILFTLKKKTQTPVVLKSDSQKALRNGPSILQLIGKSGYRIQLSLFRMGAKKQMCFLTGKLRQRKMCIYHMEFMIHIAVELFPWLSFLSYKVMIFSVEVTASNGFQWNTSKNKLGVYRVGQPFPLCFSFSPTPGLLYSGFYTTLINLLNFPVHQPDRRVRQRNAEENLILLDNMALACTFLPY